MPRGRLAITHLAPSDGNLAPPPLYRLEPRVNGFLPEAAVPAKSHVRDAVGASLRPDPLLRHARQLGDLLGRQESTGHNVVVGGCGLTGITRLRESSRRGSRAGKFFVDIAGPPA